MLLLYLISGVIASITMIFGFLRIFSFLKSSDNLWLMNQIEYKTILAWGVPISILLLLSMLFIVLDHVQKKFIKKLEKSIVITQALLVTTSGKAGGLRYEPLKADCFKPPKTAIYSRANWSMRWSSAS